MPGRYPILREAATEPPFSSPLDKEHERAFSAAQAATRNCSPNDQVRSGTGWPSFYRPLPGAVVTRSDNFGMARNEVPCLAAGGHRPMPSTMGQG